MKTWHSIVVATLLVVGLFGYGWYRYDLLSKELLATQDLFRATVTDFESRVDDLENQVQQGKNENQQLVTELVEQVGKNEQISGELNAIAKEFDKLKNIDPELLVKYSKIYFLNENYMPQGLVAIDPKYTVTEADKIAQVHINVAPYLKRLLEDADLASSPLKIISAYRSFGEQSTLKSGYKVTYGAGSANQFSADQGYSEHQLGTTVDFTTPDLGTNFTKIEPTPSYAWLTANAYKYGFVLSYPKGNQYYIFEPWHWRFVGVELATKLKNEGKYFYELDQRTIDEYLIKIFD